MSGLEKIIISVELKNKFSAQLRTMGAQLDAFRAKAAATSRQLANQIGFRSLMGQSEKFDKRFQQSERITSTVGDAIAANVKGMANTIGPGFKSMLESVGKARINPSIFNNARGAVLNFGSGLSGATGFADRFKSSLSAARGGLGKIKDAMNNSLNSFSGWAMSIMFFGMAINRVFMSIAKAATQTYQKITEGTTEGSRGILRLSAEFEYLKYVVGSAIAEALLPFIPKIMEIIDKIRVWIKENKDLTAKIIFWGAAISFVLMWIGMLVLGLKGLASFILMLGKPLIWLIKVIKWVAITFEVSLGVATATVAIVIGVILLIGVALFAIIQAVRNWGKDWAKVFKWIGIAILAVAGILLLLVGWMAAAIAAVVALVVIGVGYIIEYWDEIKTFFIAVWEAISKFFVSIWSSMVNVFKKASSSIKSFFVNIWTSIKNFFIGIWNSILGFFTGVWDTIYAIVSEKLMQIYTLFEPIIQGIKDLWTGLVDFFTGYFELLSAIFTLAMDWIKYLATEYILEPIKAAWNSMIEYFTFMWELVKVIFVAAIDMIKELATTYIIEPIKEAWNSIIDHFVAIWEIIKEVFSAAFTYIKEGWQFIIDKAIEILTPIVEWFKTNIIEPIKGLWQDLKDFVSGVFDSMLGWVKDIIGWIGKALSKAGELASNAGGSMSGAAGRVSSLSPPKKKMGGDIMRDGLYNLHAGEKVVPSTNVQNSFDGGINITVNASGSVDVSDLADELTREIKRRL